jgi:RNA polymerase sigma-70 factor (ECF subfamily)
MAFYAFDEDYVRRLANGDPETETHFVEYFSGLLLAKLRHRLRLPQEAEDLRQEVFLRVLRALRGGSGIEQPERLGAFVLSVCNYVLMEHVRGGARTTQWDENTPEPSQREDADPEWNLVSAETREQVRTLITRLSTQDQGILRALFYEERDKDAVCRDYGVGRDYLRVLLHRAKKRLRDAVMMETKSAAGATGKAARPSHLDKELS